MMIHQLPGAHHRNGGGDDYFYENIFKIEKVVRLYEATSTKQNPGDLK